MERTVTIRTPESIAFYYELAGLGSRFLALMIDLTIQSLCAVVLIIVWGISAGPLGQLTKLLNIKSSTLEALYLSIAFILMFLIFFGYFVIFEAWRNGQTPGKRLMGIRVVRDGGYPLDFTGSLIRNLVRIIESILGFYLLAAISAVASSQNKRLGDFAAGTIVVRDRAFEVTDPKRWLAGDAGFQKGIGLSGIGNLSAEDIALVQRYVDRRTTLPENAAKDAAAKIASAVRPKLGPDAAPFDDDELLVRIAAGRR